VTTKPPSNTTKKHTRSSPSCLTTSSTLLQHTSNYQSKPLPPSHRPIRLFDRPCFVNSWMQAEEACTKALSQHRSEKGYFRHAKARQMLGRADEAAKDLRALLKIQPHNAEARALPSRSRTSSPPSISRPSPSRRRSRTT
jgi:hypothetical protein